MNRLVAIGLVVACGCAKKREAPAPAQEPVAASAGSAAPDPAAVAKEEARAQGVLGPSNQGSFGDPGDLQAKGGGGGDDATARKKEPEKSGTDEGASKTKRGGEGAPAPDVTANNVTNAPPPIQPVAGPVGKLVIGQVELASKSDGAPVKAALTKRLEELQACYQDALGKTPALAGTLTLAFTLKADGSFDEIAVQASALKDASLETCITDSVKAAKLAKPLATTPVKGSIVLSFSVR